MDTQNNIVGSIVVEPIWWQDPPEISITLAQDILFSGPLTESKTVTFGCCLPDSKHRLSVEFHNKKDSDTCLLTGKDKAVIVKQIEFFGIVSPRFVWSGLYRPEYPTHMQNQPETLEYHNYLGWNGIWYLDFTVPIFTWIHKTENLGWIYD